MQQQNRTPAAWLWNAHRATSKPARLAAPNFLVTSTSRPQKNSGRKAGPPLMSMMMIMVMVMMIVVMVMMMVMMIVVMIMLREVIVLTVFVALRCRR